MLDPNKVLSLSVILIKDTHRFVPQRRFFLGQGFMKKYIVLGLLAGVSISAILIYLRKKKLEGTEFRELFDSSTVADDLFGDAFVELPDKP